jgi:hypothetical protein
VPLAEFWYNTTLHSSLGKTPFEVLYGHAPRHFGVDIVEACAIPDLQQWLRDRADMTELLRQHLDRQNLRMKNQSDKHRTERHFSAGDWVYLKLHPYVKNLLLTKALANWLLVFMALFRCWRKSARWHTDWTYHYIPKFIQLSTSRN